MLWLRFAASDNIYFGTLENDIITVWSGDMFDHPTRTDTIYRLSDVRVLTPCEPPKLIGLWNNFHERAVKENLHAPSHPLYFMKGHNCYAATGETIRRPPGYAGMVVFEAELGIVIGKRCCAVDETSALDYVFGYTCVNDVTARELLKLDPAFVHWTRAKGFDTFGVFGPTIATEIDPSKLWVKAIISGEERQNYPVMDMIFSPAQIVSLMSHDMTLEPGDVIACGTSVGAGALTEGDSVVVEIEGIGRLENTFR